MKVFSTILLVASSVSLAAALAAPMPTAVQPRAPAESVNNAANNGEKVWGFVQNSPGVILKLLLER